MLLMQRRERILGHFESSQELVRKRRAKLAVHLCAFNKYRRSLKNSPILHYVYMHTREAASLLRDIQSVRRELSVINDHKKLLQSGHHPWYVIASMKKKLPHSANLIDKLELAALGII